MVGKKEVTKYEYGKNGSCKNGDGIGWNPDGRKSNWRIEGEIEQIGRIR